MARLTPLLHGHVHMLGKYDFTLLEELAQGQLRRLHDPNTLEADLKQIEW
ncbi:hypothetical protein GCM10022631_17940 [Deinococcus rubellus]